MKFNTAYNITISCLLLLFFAGSVFIGNMIYASENTPTEMPEVTQVRLKEEVEITPIDTAEAPREVENCDYTQSVWYYDVPLTDEQQDYVFETCSYYDVPCELVFAVMGAEGSYDIQRISEDGDWGIMHINVVNHDELSRALGVTDFLDYKQNVLCGIYMLSEYYHKYTDFNKIAMCYRYGEAGAGRMWDKGVYETEYTHRIVRTIAALEYR